MPSDLVRHLLVTAEEAFADAAFCTGAFSQARNLMEQALDQARDEEDSGSEATAVEGLGLLLHYENITRRMSGVDIDATDVDAEEQFFRRALDIRRDVSDEPGAALPLFGPGSRGAGVASRLGLCDGVFSRGARVG